MFGQAEKRKTIKTKYTTRTRLRRKTKIIPRQSQKKKIQKKQDILKQQKKILLTSRGRMGEDILRTGCEGGKEILEQYMGTKRS